MVCSCFFSINISAQKNIRNKPLHHAERVAVTASYKETSFIALNIRSTTNFSFEIILQLKQRLSIMGRCHLTPFSLDVPDILHPEWNTHHHCETLSIKKCSTLLGSLDKHVQKFHIILTKIKNFIFPQRKLFINRYTPVLALSPPQKPRSCIVVALKKSVTHFLSAPVPSRWRPATSACPLHFWPYRQTTCFLQYCGSSSH